MADHNGPPHKPARLLRSSSEGCAVEARLLMRRSQDGEEPEWAQDWRRALDEILSLASSGDSNPSSSPRSCRASELRRSFSDSSNVKRRRILAPPAAPAPCGPLPPSPVEERWQLPSWLCIRRASDGSIASSAVSVPHTSFRNSFSSTGTDITVPSISSRRPSLSSVSSAEHTGSLAAPLTKVAALRIHRPRASAGILLTADGRAVRDGLGGPDSDVDEEILHLAVPAKPPSRPRKSSKRIPKRASDSPDGAEPFIPNRSSSSSTDHNTAHNRFLGASSLSGRDLSGSGSLPASLPVSYGPNSGAPSPSSSSAGASTASDSSPTRRPDFETQLSALPERPEPSPSSVRSQSSDMLSMFATSPREAPPAAAAPAPAPPAESPRIIVETTERPAQSTRRPSGDMPGHMPGFRRSVTPDGDDEDEPAHETADGSWGGGLYLGGISQSLKRLASWGFGGQPAEPAVDGVEGQTETPAPTEAAAVEPRSPSPHGSSMLTDDSATDQTAESSSEAQTPEDTIDREASPGRLPSKSPYSSGRQTPTAVTMTEYGEIMGPLPPGFEEEFAKAMADLRSQEEAEGIAPRSGDSDRASFHSTVTTIDEEGTKRTLKAKMVSASQSSTPRAASPSPESSESEPESEEDEYAPVANPAMAGTWMLQKASRKPSTARSQRSSSAPVAPPTDASTISSVSSSSSGKKKGLFGLFGRSSRASSEPPASDEPAAYVSYGTGRARPHSLLSSSSSKTGGSSTDSDSKTIGEGEHEPLPASAQPVKPVLRRKRATDNRTKRSSRAAVFSVRFANATRGLGLRAIAEQEAEHAGGTDHALAWVGVGRGRYGNLVVEGEGSEQQYAEQVDQIRKKWRAFGSRVQNQIRLTLSFASARADSLCTDGQKCGSTEISSTLLSKSSDRSSMLSCKKDGKYSRQRKRVEQCALLLLERCA